MKKVHYAMYLCDDEIFFLDIKKDKVKKEKFKSIKGEQIEDSDLFTKEFNKFVKQNHIEISLFGGNLCFIKNKNINVIVLEKYEEILKEYFKKIEFKDLSEILKIENDTGFFCITLNYIDFYYMKRNENHFIRVPLLLFNNHLKKTIHHIITNIYKSQKIMVFGNQENISKIAENIHNDYNIKTTFPEVHYHYIFEEYRK